MGVATIGSELLRRRRELGLDQLHAAKIIGVSRTTFSSYERDLQRPSVEVFPALASFLDVGIEGFLPLYGASSIAAVRPALDRLLNDSKANVEDPEGDDPTMLAAPQSTMIVAPEEGGALDVDVASRVIVASIESEESDGPARHDAPRNTTMSADAEERRFPVVNKGPLDMISIESQTYFKSAGVASEKVKTSKKKKKKSRK